MFQMRPNGLSTIQIWALSTTTFFCIHNVQITMVQPTSQILLTLLNFFRMFIEKIPCLQVRGLHRPLASLPFNKVFIMYIAQFYVCSHSGTLKIYVVLSPPTVWGTPDTKCQLSHWSDPFKNLLLQLCAKSATIDQILFGSIRVTTPSSIWVGSCQVALPPISFPLDLEHVFFGLETVIFAGLEMQFLAKVSGESPKRDPLAVYLPLELLWIPVQFVYHLIVVL